VTAYVAFLRAINVAGHAIVKMDVLRGAFTAAGCQNVQTYIQSGNVIFDGPDDADALFRKVRIQLRKLLGGEPGVLFRTGRELQALVRGLPFKSVQSEPLIKLYVVFLSEKPLIQLKLPLVSQKEAVEAIAMKKLEVFVVSHRKPNGFYGFPNNFIEKELGVSATSRNWSTVTKIVEVLQRAVLGQFEFRDGGRTP
jgi:uncharacterized protein (DUF1697 family)